MITVEQVIATWRANERINTGLLAEITDAGLAAVPLLQGGKPGRGRDVGRVFAHMCDCRWAHMRNAEKKPAGTLPKFEKGATPSRADLLAALAVSGTAVELRLTGALAAGEQIHGNHPLNFFGYLIAHDSHHRGQILIALKQNGFRLTDELRWGPWSGWFK